MTVRPINGSWDNFLLNLSYLTLKDFQENKAGLNTLKTAVESQPTLTPPNEPRMINADKLAKRIAGHSNYHGDSILAAIYCAAEGKENDVPIRPIEILPNEPLTLEQLREMDGEPVYLKVFDQILKSGWQIIKETTRERVFFRGWEPPYVRVDGIGVYYNLYRRPPEGDISNGIS